MTTYIPQPLDTSHIEFPESQLPLIERLAENTQEVWSAQRIKDVWSYGPKRDDTNKHQICLFPSTSSPIPRYNMADKNPHYPSKRWLHQDIEHLRNAIDNQIEAFFQIKYSFHLRNRYSIAC